ncbi:hypothetical protein O3P69_015292 [Scylla paramamosain]|uniref:Uncharacterized protein n=1 Tax=Scylla paramamosain TaxID=85552 RepID=A0AAW0T4E2_SCYPA
MDARLCGSMEKVILGTDIIIGVMCAVSTPPSHEQPTGISTTSGLMYFIATRESSFIRKSTTSVTIFKPDKSFKSRESHQEERLNVTTFKPDERC